MHAPTPARIGHAPRNPLRDETPLDGLAYAHVLSNGEVEASNSKNISSGDVSKPSEGVYCFNGLSFTPHNAVATIEWLSTKNGVIEAISTAVGAAAESLCEKPAQAAVFIGSVEPKSFTSGLARAFFISLN